ncbi:chaperonin GroS [Gemella bergeri ATCC 700627]|uniref:10 kDa chaperonin n=1 Tax=Gemella bergeri ATCC 700627 TaxID=1321820 RepID=U2QVQ2_9BACL|nr:co-chaperone GroES [Gemella bergeri]ERK60631.1 chaperonin GroS [Gemella bergeri ATCC 700627]
MIKPLFDNVLLKKIEQEQETTSGIVLSSTGADESNIGEVVALGESCLLSAVNEGELTTGSVVVFSDVYKKITHKNEIYYIVNEEEILAVLED